MVAPPSYTALDHGHHLPERPLTDSQHVAGDLAALATMLERLRTIVRDPASRPNRPPPLLLTLREPSGLRQRVMVLGLDALAAPSTLAVVGFFGQRRAEADRDLLEAVDMELIAELRDHPAMVAYSSLELDDGNWANMVLMERFDSLDHWRSSPKHAYAVHELSPQCYTGIRLHLALLPNGLADGAAPRLLRTKYYDFSAPTPWRGLREARH